MAARPRHPVSRRLIVDQRRQRHIHHPQEFRLSTALLLHEIFRDPWLSHESDFPCPPSGRGIRLSSLHPLGVLHLSRLCRLWVDERHGQSRLLWPGSDPKHASCRRCPLDDVHPLAPERLAEARRSQSSNFRSKIDFLSLLPSSLASSSPQVSKGSRDTFAFRDYDRRGEAPLR